ncbi:MAG: heparan-alpha-glucosaminide N-acetyltransferase [Burkholderiaceae bacterium]
MSLARRFDSVDALRGLAIVWMTVFHFCFDLNHFRYIQQDFYRDPVWTWQRAAIVSLFLFCAGLGQAIAVHQGQDWQRFWKRWAQVAGCALLVTAGSFWMYPRSFIYFGVLHGIAAMLIIVRLTAGWGRWLWLAGAIAIGSKWVGAAFLAAQPELAALFNSRALNWLGFITAKPVTEDYVPIVPWLGVMWWGMAAGQGLLARRPALLAMRLPGAAAPLAFLGRWSLSWYMLHQPVMIGVFMGIAALR